jgi:hypothetical protein
MHPRIPGRGRPTPPPELTEEERIVWRDAVEARPPHFYDPATLPVLEVYCQHVVLCNQLAAELRIESTPERRAEFRKQTAVMASLATKLRLTKIGLRPHQRTDAEEIAKTPKRRLWAVP